MQVRHSFLFTMIGALVWAGVLFAYQTGPDPASNGVFGQAACNVAGCHTGNPLNAAGGSLTLAGLPAEWTPGVTYPLTVTINRGSAVKYGFQLSAVADTGTPVQAGSFAPGQNRVSVVTGGGIQYAQHNSIATSVAPFTGIFNINWTAPATAAIGTVRFNLAANAANGDITNQNDFIYTRVDRVSPAAAEPPPPPPPPPPPGSSTRAFSILNRGSDSATTDGSGGLSQGYARIDATAGSSMPSGVAIFGYRPAGVLVSEAGVPDSPLLTEGRIYAEVSADTRVNTGLAIANPNNQAATISFRFTDSAGIDIKSGSFTLDANRQLAEFLNGNTFNSGAGIQGTFSFASTVPVSVIALRGLTNERDDFLMTTLPVIDTSLPPATGTQYLPHFADGAGWTTQILLVNPSDTTMNGSVQFIGAGDGNTPAGPATLNVNGQSVNNPAYSVLPRSSQKFVTSGTSAGLVAGSVRIIPAGGSAGPTPLVIFAYKPEQFTISEAGAPGNQGTAFRMYVESSGVPGLSGNIQSGIAIANTTDLPNTVTLELFGADGTPSSATSAPLVLPPTGQVARFLSGFFPNLPASFQGVLRITATGPVAVVGLRSRINENNGFLITTTPPSLETAPATSALRLFPHLANGGGYTTQFVVFSGTEGQAPGGELRFFAQDGSPLNLTLDR